MCFEEGRERRQKWVDGISKNKIELETKMFFFISWDFCSLIAESFPPLRKGRGRSNKRVKEICTFAVACNQHKFSSLPDSFVSWSFEVYIT